MRLNTWHNVLIIGCALSVVAVPAGALADDLAIEAMIIGGLARSFFLTLDAPAGTTTIESNPAYKASPTAAPSTAANVQAPGTATGDWPSYNRTLTSERFSPLSQINTKNVGGLKVLCTYDINVFTSFESGLIMVNNALIGSTEFDTFSLNPATCAENWRTIENYPASIIPVNRGVAYADGMLFRGTEDGRVLAYDFNTGRHMWETTIAEASHGEA